MTEIWKDGNPANNCADNIDWCTVGYNTAQRQRKRVKLQVENNGQCTLSAETVLAMRARFAECGNASQVAREFAISARHAWNICHRRLWKHI
jgi:hypothetical protein